MYVVKYLRFRSNVCTSIKMQEGLAATCSIVAAKLTSANKFGGATVEILFKLRQKITSGAKEVNAVKYLCSRCTSIKTQEGLAATCSIAAAKLTSTIIFFIKKKTKTELNQTHSWTKTILVAQCFKRRWS